MAEIENKLCKGLKRMIKKVFGSQTIIRHLCKIRKKPVVVVLGYHDIGENDLCPSWLRVPPRQFDEQLRVLGGFCNFITPGALFNPAALCLDRPNLLITFDDGYAGNLKVAARILEKYRVPAQFFISTANMQTGALFWFDKIIIPIQAQAMEGIDLRNFGLSAYRFGIDGSSSQRWSAVQLLLEDVKRIEPIQQDRIVDFFVEKFQDIIHEHFAQFRPISESELAILADNPLNYIGSHSHHHTILTRLSLDKLLDDLIVSKTLLERITQQAITAIAYPNGNTNHKVCQQVKAIGYRQAFSAFSGLVGARTDPFNIPRTLIGAYDDMPSIMFKLTQQIVKAFT